MFEKIQKKDGSIVEFDSSKITESVMAAGKETGELSERDAKKLTLRVLTLAHELRLGGIPETKDIIDLIERVLLDSPFFSTAKHFIISNADPHYMKTIFEKLQNANGHQIVKSIEFTQEYIQSGISILNFFARVLEKKYPDKEIKISIEQTGLKVRLIIDPVNGGNKEIIEKELTNYGLVVTGKMELDNYTDDKFLALELKNELRISHARIESLKDIITYQKADISRLNHFLEAVITKPLPQLPAIDINVHVPVTASAFAKSYQEITISNQIDALNEGLNKLSAQMPPNSKEIKYLMEVIEAVKSLENCTSKNKMAESKALSKIRDFINNVERAGSIAGKTITTLKDGIDTVRKLAGYYNSLAQWCGLPQIPEPFVKKI